MHGHIFPNLECLETVYWRLMGVWGGLGAEIQGDLLFDQILGEDIDAMKR